MVWTPQEQINSAQAEVERLRVLIDDSSYMLATLRSIQGIVRNRYHTTGKVEIGGLVDIAIARAEGRSL